LIHPDVEELYASGPILVQTAGLAEIKNLSAIFTERQRVKDKRLSFKMVPILLELAPCCSLQVAGLHWARSLRRS